MVLVCASVVLYVALGSLSLFLLVSSEDWWYLHLGIYTLVSTPGYLHINVLIDSVHLAHRKDMT